MSSKTPPGTLQLKITKKNRHQAIEINYNPLARRNNKQYKYVL